MKIVLVGGSGFLGQVLLKSFTNDDVVILSREEHPPTARVRYVRWDGRTLDTWAQELSDCDVLINLAGFNVNCRYNERNRARILNSRLDSTRVLGEALRVKGSAVSLWLQLSSATYYADEYRTPNDETGKRGTGFSESVVEQWEAAFHASCPTGVRGVLLRASIVLGNTGGAFPLLARLATFGLGGKQGSGKQWISWLHEVDFARMVHFFIHSPKCSGVYNVTAPNPCRNVDFMSALRREISQPIGIPTPQLLITLGTWLLRTEPELILKSRYVIPARIQREGFSFFYPKVESAIHDLVNRREETLREGS